MTRRAAVLLLFVLVGCGAHAHRTVRPPLPKLPPTIAQQLAQESDRIAQHLDQGDGCGARGTAIDLQQRTIAAINAGKVPTRFQEPLLDAVNRLATGIQCVPPAPKKHEKHKGEKKHHGKDK